MWSRTSRWSWSGPCQAKEISGQSGRLHSGAWPCFTRHGLFSILTNRSATKTLSVKWIECSLEIIIDPPRHRQDQSDFCLSVTSVRTIQTSKRICSGLWRSIVHNWILDSFIRAAEVCIEAFQYVISLVVMAVTPAGDRVLLAVIPHDPDWLNGGGHHGIRRGIEHGCTPRRVPSWSGARFKSSTAPGLKQKGGSLCRTWIRSRPQSPTPVRVVLSLLIHSALPCLKCVLHILAEEYTIFQGWFFQIGAILLVI